MRYLAGRGQRKGWNPGFSKPKAQSHAPPPPPLGPAFPRKSKAEPTERTLQAGETVGAKPWRLESASWSLGKEKRRSGKLSRA